MIDSFVTLFTDFILSLINQFEVLGLPEEYILICIIFFFLFVLYICVVILNMIYSMIFKK